MRKKWVGNRDFYFRIKVNDFYTKISSFAIINPTFNTKKKHHKLAFWSMVENHFENNTIRCEKLATIVSGQKNVVRPFVRRKQVSTSAEMYVAVTFRHSCLPVFAWWRVRAIFFWPETIAASFLHLMVFFSKWFSTMLQNASLWCSFFVFLYYSLILCLYRINTVLFLAIWITYN